jgi:hypothetical protein
LKRAAHDPEKDVLDLIGDGSRFSGQDHAPRKMRHISVLIGRANTGHHSIDSEGDRQAHDPEKWEPVFGEDHAPC